MKRWVVVCYLFVAAMALFSGCKKGSDPAAQGKAFASATPEIQAAWNAAVGASKSNDYATAYLSLRDMRAIPTLTPEQTSAIDALSTSVNDRMTEAATKGDPKALKAVEDVRAAVLLQRSAR